MTNSKNSKNNKKIPVALLGIAVALAMVLSYLESMIPPIAGIPGIKIGLANIVTMVILLELRTEYAVLVAMVRVILSSLLFGSIAMIPYGMAGAIASIMILLCLKQNEKISLIGKSMCGGVVHNMAQLVVASAFLENVTIFFYTPILILSGAIMGMLTGTVARIVTKAIRN